MDRQGRLEALAGALLGIRGATDRFATDSLVALGGDSLLAMRLAARAREELAVRVSIQPLLSDVPLRSALADAAELEGLPDRPAPSATTAASPGQRGMWAAERLVGGSLYGVVFTAFVDGPLDAALLEAAIQRTVERHEGLRTAFPFAGGDLQRVVLPGWQAPVSHPAAPAGHEFAPYVRTLAAQQGRRPFDLATPPLRFLLASGGPERHALVLISHHLLLDGWAVGLALKEIVAQYDALDTGGQADLASAPGFHVLLGRQVRLRESGEWGLQAAFWRRRLREVPTGLDLPADRPRPLFQDPAGAQLPFELAPELTTVIRRAAAQLGVTPFAHLLAAFGLVLARHAGQRRLLVGVPVAGRPTSELQHLVAQCTQVVPVVVEIDEDVSAGELVRGVQRSLAESLAHADLPLDELVRQSGIRGDLSRNPLVSVVCGMYDQVVGWHLASRHLTVRVEEGHAGAAPMDLTLAVQRTDPGLAGTLEYATAVWREAEATGFLADVLTAMEELTAAGTRVEDVRAIGPRGRELLDRLNATASPRAETSIERCFLQRAGRMPDGAALRDGDRSLTYRELAQAASVQARLLRDNGVAPGDMVAVGVPRGEAEIVAVLGILWAGAAYVAIDDSLPVARLKQILRLVRPRAAVADAPLSDRLAAAGVPLVASWQPGWERETLGPEPWAAADPGRVAYVAFTSGSSGVPKGVTAPHRGVLRLVSDVDYVRLGPPTRFLRFAPLSFDASTLEIWGPLLNGGALEVFPPGVPSPAELGGFLADQGVTALWLTAELFRLLAEFTPGSFAGVQQLLTGGDIVAPDAVAALLLRHPGLVVTNGYGPTENTTFTTVHRLPAAGEVEDPLPIGSPLPNTRVYVLDDRHRLLPPGAIGELHAAGDGLAAGYLRDPEETARQFGRFSPDVGERLYRTGDLVRIGSDGCLRFLGRRDDQVKIRGFRVEPEEVRRVLCAHPGVEAAVALAIAGGTDGQRQLLAVYVPREGGPAAEELRHLVSSQLPHYMVPSSWLAVERIPVTGNGKVDRDALIRAAVEGAAR